MRGHCQPCVLNLNASWKFASLEEDEETRSAHFPHFGIPPEGPAGESLFFLFFFSPPFPPRLSPLSLSCIITSRFRDGGGRGASRRGGKAKAEGGLRGWEGRRHMFVSITAWPQRGDRAEECFLTGRRKRAVSQEGSDIVNPPPLFPCASFSHSPGSLYLSNCFCR